MIFTQGEGGTTKEISYLIAPLYIFRSVNNFFIFDVGRDDFCTDGPAAGPHWVLREVARAWEASVSEAVIATEPLLRRVIYVVFHEITGGGVSERPPFWARVAEAVRLPATIARHRGTAASEPPRPTATRSRALLE